MMPPNLPRRLPDKARMMPSGEEDGSARPPDLGMLLRTQQAFTVLRTVFFMSIVYVVWQIVSGVDSFVLAMLVLWLAILIAFMMRTGDSLKRLKSDVLSQAAPPEGNR